MVLEEIMTPLVSLAGRVARSGQTIHHVCVVCDVVLGIVGADILLKKNISVHRFRGSTEFNRWWYHLLISCHQV